MVKKKSENTACFLKETFIHKNKEIPLRVFPEMYCM